MVDFDAASPADDAAIRRFLAGQTMHGRIHLELRTEPSFMDAVATLGENAEVLLARARDTGEIVGLGVRTRRRVWMDGVVRNIGHLSFLRIAEPFRRRRDFLRMGFAALGDMQRQNPVAFHLTAILKENSTASRLLAAGVKGLPVYTPLAVIVTFTLGTFNRRLRLSAENSRAGQVHESEQEALAGFIAGQHARMALAPVRAQFPCADFVAARAGSRFGAAAALWDQRNVRQWVVKGYGGILRTMRPTWNIWQKMRGHAPLPEPGAAVNLACVSCLAVNPDAPEALEMLLRLLADRARQHGVDYLVLSLAAAHPLAAVAARVSSHQTESVLYSVRWPDDPVVSLSGIPYVEAGLL